MVVCGDNIEETMSLICSGAKVCFICHLNSIQCHHCCHGNFRNYLFKPNITGTMAAVKKSSNIMCCSS